ncbi:hypothetical protein GCM10010309_63490 [Streptomyces violaceochromogenes]|nr:hypothetical protein GCM10010309_63490 [Streptomyces violaceochromogenes]
MPAVVNSPRQAARWYSAPGTRTCVGRGQWWSLGLTGVAAADVGVRTRAVRASAAVPLRLRERGKERREKGIQ